MLLVITLDPRLEIMCLSWWIAEQKYLKRRIKLSNYRKRFLKPGSMLSDRIADIYVIFDGNQIALVTTSVDILLDSTRSTNILS